MVLARYQSSKLQVSRFGELLVRRTVWDNRLAIFRYVGKIWDAPPLRFVPTLDQMPRNRKTLLKFPQQGERTRISSLCSFRRQKLKVPALKPSFHMSGKSQTIGDFAVSRPAE